MLAVAPRSSAGSGCRARSATRGDLRADAEPGFLRRIRVGGRSGGSRRRMRNRKTAEARKLTASARIASGAVTSPDEAARQAGPHDLGGRAADLQLGVALHDLVALHEGRQVGLVGDVEEDRGDAGDEADHVQLLDRQDAQLPCHRDRPKAHRATQVADDEDGRRRRRSTQTPAGRLNRMNGRNSMVPSSATSNGLAFRTSGDDSGIASRLTCVPNWLIVSRRPRLREVGVAKRDRGRNVMGSSAGLGRAAAR